MSEGLGVSLHKGATGNFSGGQDIDAEAASIDPMLDDGRGRERLGAHVVSHDRARFTELDATELDIPNGEHGVDEAIEPDASGN
ncbi:MAG: hypothetical protein JJU27_06215 [Gammaproteobacteria bacterium]|nr:hypothetical protein [Gammaproteobacteria bacterium]